MTTPAPPTPCPLAEPPGCCAPLLPFYAYAWHNQGYSFDGCSPTFQQSCDIVGAVCTDIYQTTACDITLDGFYVSAAKLTCGAGDDYVVFNNAYAYIGIIMAASLRDAQETFPPGSLIANPDDGSGCWAKTLPF